MQEQLVNFKKSGKLKNNNETSRKVRKAIENLGKLKKCRKTTEKLGKTKKILEN